LARERYAANLEVSRAKLRAKRLKMGVKYRAQVKRSRTKVRATPEGMLCHRMGQSIRSALRGAKRRCKWETLVGYSVAELREHLERQFLPGMTWERFFGGEIHIHHIIRRSDFQYASPEDENFRKCWALSNLCPLWEYENTRDGALHRWYSRKSSGSYELRCKVGGTVPRCKSISFEAMS
jgi:hypothetical protein